MLPANGKIRASIIKGLEKGCGDHDTEISLKACLTRVAAGLSIITFE
jgi:hypothetical protein